MIYFFVFVLLLCLLPLDRPGLRSTYQLLGFTVLLVLLGARWETGTDWDPYIEYFRDLDNYRNFEPGYVLLNEAVRFFSNNYTLFLFINGTLALAPIFWFIRKESNGSIPLGLVIFYSYYYLITYFGASRRIIAIGLCVLAAMQLLQKKRTLAFLLILMGSIFHYSAMLCIIYFLLPGNLLSIRHTFRFAISVAASLGLIYALLPLLLNIDVFSHIFFRVGEYLLGDTSVDGYDKATLSVLSVVKRLGIITFIILTLGINRSKITAREIFFSNCYFFSFAIYLLSEIVLGDIFKTFTIYFSIFEIVLIPNLIRTHEPRLRVFLYGLFVPYLILQTYSATFGNPFVDLYIPYRLAPDFRWIGE